MDNAGIVLDPFEHIRSLVISIAALQALMSNDESLLLVLAADHVIQNIDVFHHAVNIVREYANQDTLVTFGIMPTSANTNYDYLKA